MGFRPLAGRFFLLSCFAPDACILRLGFRDLDLTIKVEGLSGSATLPPKKCSLN